MKKITAVIVLLVLLTSSVLVYTPVKEREKGFPDDVPERLGESRAWECER